MPDMELHCNTNMINFMNVNQQLILFQTTISKAKWPSDDFLPYLAQKAGIKPKEVLADEGQGKQQSKVPGAFCVTN